MNITRIVALLFIFMVLLKIYFITYSYPYLFHTDESYLLKDPLKLLLLYKKGNFSSSTNLYFWLSSVYTGFVFIIGKVFHLWGSMSEFQNMIVGDSPCIYLAGRILSLLFSSVGSLLLVKYMAHFVKDTVLFILFALLIFFNPIEIYSNNWVKFDPFCYFYFSIMLNLIHARFFGTSLFARKYLYVFLVLGLAVRIDFIALLAAVFLYDCRREGIRNALVSNFKPVSYGILAYLFVTLLPLSFFYNMLHAGTSQKESIRVVKSFESAILKRLINEDPVTILYGIGANLRFYLVDCLLYGLGPVSILLIFYRLKDSFKKAGYLLIFSLILMVFLLISSASMPHYSLLISVCVLLLSFISITYLPGKKWQYALAGFSVIFVLTIVLQDILISRQKDPRINAKEYLLRTTSPSELLAIDKFNMPGFAPPLQECKTALRKKAELVLQYNEGTGETFKAKANLDDAGCRPILEIFDEDPFLKDPVYKGYFVNSYDTLSFEKKNIRIFVTPFDLLSHHDRKFAYFYLYILKKYSLAATFTQQLKDPRMNNLYPFSTAIYIYEKKKL